MELKVNLIISVRSVPFLSIALGRSANRQDEVDIDESLQQTLLDISPDSLYIPPLNLDQNQKVLRL